jgi:hypothetical protein
LESPPKLQRLIFKPIPSDATRVAAIQTGEIDVAAGIPPESISQLQSVSCLRVDSVQGQRVMYASMDGCVKPFDDKRVRQAMNYAVDVDSIIQNVLDGNAQRIAGPIAKDMYGYDEGKAYLVEAGVFQDVSAAIMVHPSMKTQVVASLISMQEIVVEYWGKAAHASSKPQDGINALDALVMAYVGIATLRQHIRWDARIHGIITNGGAVPNVVPDYASGRFFVRAKDDEYLDQLVQRVLACFRSGAEATGARLEYRFPSKRYSAMRSNPTLAAVFTDNLHLLGLAETPPDPTRGSGSSDMGNVSQVVPALHPPSPSLQSACPAIHCSSPSMRARPRACRGRRRRQRPWPSRSPIFSRGPIC